MMWKPGETCPRDSTPVFIRVDACVSVAVYSEAWHGWVALADGHDARDARGDLIVIDKPHRWMPVPDLEIQ
jgi:hypothetical protein